MEVPRLEVELGLQLLAYTTATAMQDLSHVFDLHHTAHSNAGSLAHWTRPGVEPASSWMLVRFVNPWATTGTPDYVLLKMTQNGVGYLQNDVVKVYIFYSPKFPHLFFFSGDKVYIFYSPKFPHLFFFQVTKFIFFIPPNFPLSVEM